eukprot:tig00021348_g20595.t1
MQPSEAPPLQAAFTVIPPCLASLGCHPAATSTLEIIKPRFFGERRLVFEPSLARSGTTFETTHFGVVKAISAPLSPPSPSSSLPVVQWTKSISSALRYGRVTEALRQFEEMQLRGVSPNRITYGVLIKGLLDHRKDVEARRVRDRMIAAGIEPDVTYYTSVMASYLKRGNVGLAIRAFRDMQRARVTPNVVSYSVLMRAHARRGDLTRAMAALAEMRAAGVAPDSVVYNVLIDICTKAGKWESAIELREQMRAEGVEPDATTFNTLLYARTKMDRNRVDGAMEILDEMRAAGITPDTATFNVLITACIKSGDLERAFRLRADMQAQDIKENTVTCNALLGALTANGLWEDVRQLRREMKEKRIREDVVTYNSLLTAAVSQQRFDMMLSLRREMKRASVRKNITTYNILIGAYTGVGDLGTALQLKAEMRLHGIRDNLITYSAFVDAYAKAGDFATAAQLREEMRKAGFGGASERSLTTAALLDAYCKRNDGQLETARQLRGEMGRAGVPASKVVFNALVMAYAKNNRIGEALQLREEARNAGMRDTVTSFNALIDYYARHADLERAYALREEMREAGLRENAFTYAALIAALCRRGDLDGAERLRAEMHSRAIRDNVLVYNAFLRHFAALGDVDSCEQVRASMRRAGLKEDQEAYRCLIEAYERKLCCLVEGSEQATETPFEDLEDAGVPSPRFFAPSPLDEESEEEDMDEDFDLMDEEEEEDLRADRVTQTAPQPTASPNQLSASPRDDESSNYESGDSARHLESPGGVAPRRVDGSTSARGPATMETLRETPGDVLDSARGGDELAFRIWRHPHETQRKIRDSVLRLRASGRTSITVLVLGRSGSGKTATISSLLGEPILSRETEMGLPEEHVRTLDGFTVRLIDMPGFLEGRSSPASAAQVTEALRSRLREGQVDVVFYVDRLDSKRVEYADRCIMSELTRVLGRKVWTHTILVLTHGVLAPPDDMTWQDYFLGRSKVVITAIRETLAVGKVIPTVDVPVCVVENSRQCPTNNDKEYVLPNEVPWVAALFAAAAARTIQKGAVEYEPLDEKQDWPMMVTQSAAAAVASVVALQTGCVVQ